MYIVYILSVSKLSQSRLLCNGNGRALNNENSNYKTYELKLLHSLSGYTEITLENVLTEYLMKQQ